MTLRGGGMDIFWNHTFSATQYHAPWLEEGQTTGYKRLQIIRRAIIATDTRLIYTASSRYYILSLSPNVLCTYQC